MTTATVTTKTYEANDVIKLTNYQTFTWQAIKKIAKEVGVEFYSASSYTKAYGLGFRAHRVDATKIVIDGYERGPANNNYAMEQINRLANENMMLKLQLWAIKNNISFEYTPAKDFQSAYIRIVKVGA